MDIGSGSLAAMATFEDRYRPNMEVRFVISVIGIGIVMLTYCHCVTMTTSVMRL